MPHTRGRADHHRDTLGPTTTGHRGAQAARALRLQAHQHRTGDRSETFTAVTRPADLLRPWRSEAPYGSRSRGRPLRGPVGHDPGTPSSRWPSSTRQPAAMSAASPWSRDAAPGADGLATPGFLSASARLRRRVPRGHDRQRPGLAGLDQRARLGQRQVTDQPFAARSCMAGRRLDAPTRVDEAWPAASPRGPGGPALSIADALNLPAGAP